MEISVSRRVKTALSDSFELAVACDSAYDQYVSVAQKPNPIFRNCSLWSAALLLHVYLTLSHLQSPLIVKWVSSSPSQPQIDSAFRVTVSRRWGRGRDHIYSAEEEILEREEFKEWAVEAFTESVVANARKALLSWILGGVVGIVGIGAVTQFPMGLIVAAIGVYTLGIATWIFLSLSD